VQKFHGANFFHSQKFGQLDVVVGGNYYTDDSYLQGNYNTRGRLNTNLRYRFKHIDGLSIGLNVNAQKAQGSNFFVWAADDKAKYIKGKYYPDSTAYYKPSGGVDTPKTTLSASKTYRYNIDPYLVYNTKSGYKFSWRNRFFNMNNENNTNQNSNAKLYYSELQAQKTFAHQFNITAGLMANYSDVRSQLFGNHTADNYAGYLQIEKKIGKRLWLAGGGRYEFYRVDTVKAITKPLGRIGLNYQAAKATFIRASYGMGYRFPTIAEKYVNTIVSGINIFPNPTLKPEKGWNAEIGAKQNFIIGKWIGMLDVAAFYTRYYDMMEFTFDNFPTPSKPVNLGFQSRNIANTEVKGIDVSLFTTTKIKMIQLDFHSGFTYNLPRDLAFDTMRRDIRTSRYSDTSQNILKYRYTTSWKTNVELKWK
jgi:iron complex outermembrane receptor protein